MSRLNLVFISFLVFTLFFTTNALAQTLPDVPTPQPGTTQTDFAKDLESALSAIEKDADALEDIKFVEDNEIDGGHQGDESEELFEDLDLDETPDMDEIEEETEFEEDKNEPEKIESKDLEIEKDD